MEIVNDSSAGTLESSDVMITVTRNFEKGISIELTSPVKQQFGDCIEEVILECTKKLGITDAKIIAVDQGALDCVIKARTLTALYRACNSKSYIWEF